MMTRTSTGSVRRLSGRRMLRATFSVALIAVLGSALVVGGAAAFFESTGYRPVILVGASMPPTLWGGEMVLWRPVDVLRRGDVVVYWYQGVRFVHRIAGLPGETIAVRAGAVLIDGGAGPAPLAEPYVHFNTTWDHPAITIPAGHYLIMQDNRIGGGSVMDVVERSAVEGRADWVVLPPWSFRPVQ
ncbi:MAG: signal peptidase I [Chloroflexi bacterium]|nr:signal peptidase I [Chloroflexota bacterium]